MLWLRLYVLVDQFRHSQRFVTLGDLLVWPFGRIRAPRENTIFEMFSLQVRGRCLLWRSLRKINSDIAFSVNRNDF